jgi:aerobic carbon-monoxide dehydrogenase small subunit
MSTAPTVPTAANVPGDPTAPRAISLQVNGSAVSATVEVRLTLADFLRHQLELTGTHLGCEHGVCGACTVLVDGRSARSCLMLAVQADGCAITTVEGIAAADGTLHPLQQAFKSQHGLQCGFCTPGMLTTLLELLHDNPDPSEAEVRVAISGNLCRCTGYQAIVDAALVAARSMRAGTKQPTDVAARSMRAGAKQPTDAAARSLRAGASPPRHGAPGGDSR